MTALYGELVREVNNGLANFETLKRFRVVADEWTQESGELTPSMKLKRRVINDRYAAVVAELYADEATSRGAIGAPRRRSKSTRLFHIAFRPAEERRAPCADRQNGAKQNYRVDAFPACRPVGIRIEVEPERKLIERERRAHPVTHRHESAEKN